MKRALLVAVAVLMGFAAFRAPAEPENAVSPRADALDLLVLAGEKPARLELRVAIDGKSVQAVWDETFARHHAFFDRDGNGSLDKLEAARLPSAFALRQVLWGQLSPFTGTAPPFGELDANGDGEVGANELADYYRRSGLGGVLVGVGRPPATDQLTAALLKHLDPSKDGTVGEVEWKAAAETLRKLDGNDDELIGPGELVDGTAYPGALGSVLLTAPDAAVKPDPIADAVPVIVLPLRTADTQWASAVATRREREGLPAIPGEAVLALRGAAPAAAWQVRFGADKNVSEALEPVGGRAPANRRLVLTAGPTRLELRTDEGKLTEQIATVRKQYSAQFAEGDANSDGRLDAAELAAPKAGRFKRLLEVADRDGDGTLHAKELTAWLDLQAQVANGHVLLTLLDHGPGLFELLDADHDGSLSVRELRGAWARVNATVGADGRLDRTRLPRQLLATVSRGHPKSALGKPVGAGPAWFLAMDRNGDGDVSRREFTGPADVFDRLDSDKDGLLSPEEAAKAQRP